MIPIEMQLDLPEYSGPNMSPQDTLVIVGLYKYLLYTTTSNVHIPDSWRVNMAVGDVLVLNIKINYSLHGGMYTEQREFGLGVVEVLGGSVYKTKLVVREGELYGRQN